MINHFRWEGATYQFVAPQAPAFPGASTYTVIVGKNGTGKSRLMRALARRVLGQMLPQDALERDDPHDRAVLDVKLNGDEFQIPSRVICVSTSAFDKFPMMRREFSSDLYAYLGVRGLPSLNMGLAYLSKIIAALLSSINEHPDRAQAVCRVLDYLEYAPEFKATFTLSPTGTSALKQLVASAPVDVKLKNVRQVTPMRRYSSDGGLSEALLGSLSDERFAQALPALQRFSSGRHIGKFEVRFEGGLLSTPELEQSAFRDALQLLDVGLLRLRSVVVRKASGRFFRINDASSGEQSVLLGLLGIASHIQPNSLVCIDEPEVCLHPEWQRKYISLLMSLFAGYRGCQFLIATHSPQIVSELEQHNCFVLSMEDRETRPAWEYAHRSADFQLATVFKDPGRSNEYILRTALTLLATTGRRRSFTPEDLVVLNFLRSIRHELPEQDPGLELIDSLEEMATRYA